MDTDTANRLSGIRVYMTGGNLHANGPYIGTHWAKRKYARAVASMLNAELIKNGYTRRDLRWRVERDPSSYPGKWKIVTRHGETWRGVAAYGFHDRMRVKVRA